ncbi:DUF6894 family protein [Bradyrhizobium sp. U531]|uniref:DUF6894 family protein n=1 Tax=Bradyrhizobium sp. U531 TaxID=3053458 RepID=UPI003F6882D1
MKQFFFDLAGSVSAHDRVGHPCVSRREAKEHAKFIAHRIGAEKPELSKRGILFGCGMRAALRFT